MASLPEAVPDVDVVLALQPEELAGFVLLDLITSPDITDPWKIHPRSYVNQLFQLNREYYPPAQKDSVGRAILEAWNWLVNEGLLAEEHEPSSPREYFITRRGRSITTAQDFAAYRRASLLPKELLHPTIVEKCWPTFLRGDHDTAVFQAFKEVEVAVRAAGNFADTDLGTDLMRKAFHIDSGRLTDASLPAAERESLAHLFAGAIGSYKNPQSHRTVAITDPMDAVEMIILASHLLRIVDSRPLDSP